jgi:hypothetical protein
MLERRRRRPRERRRRRLERRWRRRLERNPMRSKAPRMSGVRK